MGMARTCPGRAWVHPQASSTGEPLATTYYTGVPLTGGLGRIVVFTVAQNGSQDFELFTQWHTGLGWGSGWTDQDAPPELRGDKFKLTSAVVWYQGSSKDLSNLRINAFGYSEEISGQRAGGLVEFFWNGQRWDWAPVRYAPDGQSFRTTHSTVMDDPDHDRIVVVGRTSTGRIWEYVREYDGYQLLREKWNDLSFEPNLRRVPTIGFGG